MDVRAHDARHGRAAGKRDRLAAKQGQPRRMELRVDLAATYRLVAAYGWDDMIFTHISARVPGPEHHFLINPYGLLFEEITASSLVKIDLDGNKVAGVALSGEPGGLHHPQRASHEPRRRALHRPSAHDRRHGRLGAGRRTAAARPACDADRATTLPITTMRALRWIRTSASGWCRTSATSTSCCCAITAR